VFDGKIALLISTTNMMHTNFSFCKKKKYKTLSVAQDRTFLYLVFEFLFRSQNQEIALWIVVISRWFVTTCIGVVCNLNAFFSQYFRYVPELSNCKRLIQRTNVLKWIKLLFSLIMRVSGNISAFPLLYSSIVL
jgi:hypothetical protein